MKNHTRLVTVLLTVFLIAVFSAWKPARAQQKKKDVPETVFVTYHAKAGSETGLEKLITRQWTVARRMNLFNATPHVLVRGVEGDKTFFVEVVQWRDEDIPDHSPAEIQEIWKEMNAMVERRNGRPGIDLIQVALVKP